MKKIYLTLLLAVLLSGCMSYETLNEMRTELAPERSSVNIEELIEYLQEPCEDPNLYAHVMQTAHYISLNSKLNLHRPKQQERLLNVYQRILVSFDESEIDEWEGLNIANERAYLQTLALQFMFKQDYRASEKVDRLMRLVSATKTFTAEQSIIFFKQVHELRKEFKKHPGFCNEIIAAHIQSPYKLKHQEELFFAKQISYLMNNKSAYLIEDLADNKHQKLYLKVFLNYISSEDMLFTASYNRKNLLSDISTFNFIDKQYKLLRDRLYKRHLNFERMNDLLAKKRSLKYLRLNARLWDYSVKTALEGKSIEYLRKNYQLLVKLVHGKDPVLASEARLFLLKRAPLAYVMTLIKEGRGAVHFGDIVNTVPLFLAHRQLDLVNQKIYQTSGGRRYVSPYILLGGELGSKLDSSSKLPFSTAKLLKDFFMVQSTILCRESLVNKEVNWIKFQQYINAVQSLTILGESSFSGKYNQIDSFKKILNCSKLKVYERIQPYMWKRSQAKTLATIIDVLKENDFELFQLEFLVQLYNKTAIQDRRENSDALNSLLIKCILQPKDDLSLAAVKHCFSTFEAKNWPQISIALKKRWPEFLTELVNKKGALK